MSKLLDAFGIYFIIRTILWMLIGETFIKPLSQKIIDEIAQIPRVLHYLEHNGKSWNCDICNEVRHVDSIN